MAKVDYLLHESSVGYALFEVVYQADVVGNRLRAVRDAMIDLSRFGKMVKLVSFAPFQYVDGNPGVFRWHDTDPNHDQRRCSSVGADQCAQ